MKLIWPNAFEELVNEDREAELFAYYDESLKKTSVSRIEFFSLISRCAAILRSAHVEKGDVVLCTLPLCLEAAVLHYGATCAGAAVIHSAFTPDNPALFEHLATKSNAKFIVMRTESFDPTWAEFKGNVGQINQATLSASFSYDKFPNAKKAILINRGGENDFLSYVRSYPAFYINRDVSEDDLAIIVLTSGTTGVPKLAMKTHQSVVMDRKHGVVPHFVAPKVRRYYNNAPWSWVISSSFDILAGYTRVHPDLWYQPKDAFKLYANIIKTDRIGVMFLPPPELKGVQANWDDKTRKIAEWLLVAGFPVTKELCKWFFTATEKICVRFGCSEMISVSYNIITKPEDFEDYDCGAIYDGTVVRLVNDNMQDLPKGTAGRILLKSESMFHGYMGQPDKTAEALDASGWYVTTDAGYINDKNHLFIIGRYDYVIKHKGKQYYPSSFEKAIRGHPQVKDVLAVPIPHDQNHHNICCYVVKEANSKLTEKDVIQFVANSAGKNKSAVGDAIPPQHVIFTESIDMNIRGKIDRNKMIADAIKITKG